MPIDSCSEALHHWGIGLGLTDEQMMLLEAGMPRFEDGVWIFPVRVKGSKEVVGSINQIGEIVVLMR